MSEAAETISETIRSRFDDLTRAEREYCDRLQRGELVPELLFPDAPELAARVEVSPPLQWKARNARRQAGRA